MAQFNCQAGALAKWLENLPRGSIGKTAELLYKALQDINTQEITPADRFRVLESIREPIHYVTENMRTHFSTMTIPPSEKTKLIIDACRAFYAGMAACYQLVIRDADQSLGVFAEHKIKLVALHRALTYIGRALLTAYEVYATSHHDNWGKLHSLYAIAEHTGMTNMAVTDELAVKTKTTITEVYLRILLLSMTSPYNLRQGEIGKIYDYLESLVGLASLEVLTAQSLPVPAGLPIVNLATDYPPELINPNTTIEKIENYRQINPKRLIEKIKEELEQTRESNLGTTKPPTLASQYDISPDLLRRLIESWGHLKKRKYNRHQVMTPVKVGVGLFNVHQLMVRNVATEGGTLERANRKAFDRVTKYNIDISEIKSNLNDVWASVYPGIEVEFETQGHADLQGENSTELSQPASDTQWTLLNQSADGFSLMCLLESVQKLQVGELLSIWNQDAPPGKNWSIGIVKWLKSYGTNGIELGGQLIAPFASPVGLTSNRDNKDAVPTRGLLLPELANLNRPSSIICFSRLYRVGDILRIKHLDREDRTVQLSRMTGNNNIINQFLYSEFGKNTRRTRDVEEPSIEIDIRKFKDVWNSI